MIVNVLVACEFSGVVRDAFIAKGHNAVSCDLLPTEKDGPHIQGDVLQILETPPPSITRWDMMIAHPPCTHLSLSGARWFSKKRKDGRQQAAISFFLALANATIPKICIENPACIMSSIYRKPDQIVHPYYFGESFQKTTWLWLKNLPQLIYVDDGDMFDKPTVVDRGPMKKFASGKTMPLWYYEAWKMPNAGHIRSITFSSIANAMASQWSEDLD
jgi:hypothetical protein